MSVPDRPQESLQKEFRVPAMMAHEEGPPGVGVGQGAFGGHLLSPQALNRNIAAIPALMANVGSIRFTLFPCLLSVAGIEADSGKTSLSYYVISVPDV